MFSFSIGCHVSIAGGVVNAPGRAADLGCETFQIFTRSPQGGPAPAITEEVIFSFKEQMLKFGFNSFVVHCPYYINFGSGKSSTYHGSISVVRQELERTSLLGGQYVMFHSGSGKDLGKKEAIKQAREGLKKVLDDYTGSALLLIEIAAGAGEILGDTFEEVAEIMEPLKKYKSFGGVCFDTQHGFSSGYDLRTIKTVKETFNKFDSTIGFKWLKMSHVNDSKVELGGRKDRHEHIGQGNIGEGGFKALLSFLNQEFNLKAEKTWTFPLIFETEHDKVETDIKILKDLRKKLKK